MTADDVTSPSAPPTRSVSHRWWAPGGVARGLRRRWRWVAGALLAVVILVWALAPALRAVSLVAGSQHRTSPDAATAGLPVQDVAFTATDGVRLAGWLALASPQAPTIILLHGFKGSRVDMLPWARFLFAAGYNVLLFDDRGCGQSADWQITLGAREPDDVIGAVRYLQLRADLKVKRFGALGISLGAGVALLAAAREPGLLATVADSPWATEDDQLARMATLPLGHFALPALPYEPALVDTLIGARLANARPVAVIGQIAPRAVFLIHAADDANATTTTADERALYAAARQPKAEWIVPHGGHVGALRTYPAEYQRRVLAFFAQYLGQP